MHLPKGQSVRISVLAFMLLFLLHLLAPARGQEIVVQTGKKSLEMALKEAKAGSMIVLSAGIYPGGITLPEGVGLRGAGYENTTIDAGSQPFGIAIKGGKSSRIEDLTVRTKGSSAVVVEGATNVEMRRLRLIGGALGVRWKEVQGGRIENVIVADAPIGISLSHVKNSAVVNCTIANASSIGLSVVDVENCALFNNLVADAGTAIMISGGHEGLRVDYNLYRSLFSGKIGDQASRVSLGPWRDVSGGMDARSVNLPVRFSSAESGDFRPVSVLDWDPTRTTTANWGAATFAGFMAPTVDMDGNLRVSPPDVGVYEAPPLHGPRPDGSFEISDDAGTKSAGVFRPDGTLVRYLFHNLPLKKGKYEFVLPSRSQLGAPISAGSYEVRVVESQLGWEYRTITGNSGVDSRKENTDSAHIAHLLFGPDGELLLGSWWNERNENVRSLDLKTRKARWVFNGTAELNGMTIGPDKNPLVLRRASAKDTFTLTRLDQKTGRPIAWPVATQGTFVWPDAKPDGIAVLDDILYIADPAKNRLYARPMKDLAKDTSVDLPTPTKPVSDPKRKVLWMLSGLNKVLAWSPTGGIVAEFTEVQTPVGVAVAGDRLAIASAATGKIHIFDCTDPKKLKPLKTIGTGDGPYGPLQADRFHFQSGAWDEPKAISLALDDEGRVAVRDRSQRLIVLTNKGEPLYSTIAQFGNKPTAMSVPGEGRTRIFDHRGRFSWWIDAKAGRWEPDAYWGVPAEASNHEPIGYFTDAGKTFGIFHAEWKKQGAVLIARFDGYLGKPVLIYAPGKDGWVVYRDKNKDGVIDDKDGVGEPVLDADGKPVRWHLAARWIYADPSGSGDFRSMTDVGADGVGILWKRKGLDADGVPIYRFEADAVLRVKEPSVPSPYDFGQAEDLRHQSESYRFADGRLVASMPFRHSPRGMGLSNSGATDLASFRPDGSMRWLRPLNDFTPIQGIKRMDNGLLTSWGHQCEWMGLDEDGLGLGNLGFPAAAHWTGMWVDHPDQYLTFIGNDGQLQVVVGDYMVNGSHWLTMKHTHDFKKTTFPFTLDAAGARVLAFRPRSAFALSARPGQPKVVIRRLTQPMTIDGDMEKWRKANITPQILITPVTASGSIDGPKDASAIVRMAYEGQNLYVQVIRFDDLVTFHQPYSKSHLQDTVEIMLNGFFEGFQWSVSNFTDVGPAMVRRRFFAGALEDLTPASHAPRSVKVLDNAKSVSERSLIETAYGIDMSDCKVIVTEFKLPIDKITYKGSEQSIFSMQPGSTFWLGFLICDNDVPGADIQDVLVWPASYGTFNPKEDGALAIIE